MVGGRTTHITIDVGFYLMPFYIVMIWFTIVATALLAFGSSKWCSFRLTTHHDLVSSIVCRIHFVENVMSMEVNDKNHETIDSLLIKTHPVFIHKHNTDSLKGAITAMNDLGGDTSLSDSKRKMRILIRCNIQFKVVIWLTHHASLH